MSKYDGLTEYLRAQPRIPFVVSFRQIEEIVGQELPASAAKHRPWWANRRGSPHANSWLNAGWKTADVQVEGRKLRFEPLTGRAGFLQDEVRVMPDLGKFDVSPRSGLSIAEAKNAMAEYYGILPDQIEVQIRG